jgi:NADP-dependent 3-hydroxy acid dehydrogenase YdfG
MHRVCSIVTVSPYGDDVARCRWAWRRGMLMSVTDFTSGRGDARVGATGRENPVSGIEGKVVVVTGASSGIGAATALLLAERGARLVLGARRSDRLEALAARIAEVGREPAWARTDVTRREDLSDLVALACERHGRLDVLVNNAGIGPISPLDDLRVEEWEAMIDVNVKGVLYGIAAALPVFRRQGFGHFVNVASTAAHRIVPNQSVYAATKTAVRVISEGLRQEAGDKLRVTVVTPGFTRTDFADDVTNADVKAQIAASKDRFAMPPDAIARAIAYAIEQPADIDVGEVVVRPTAQG